MVWVSIHFANKPGLIMGPFEDIHSAFTEEGCLRADLDGLNYEAMSVHRSLEEALADRGTTMSFQPAGQ